MEKVKNFKRNYLESEKFFSKFSYFLERENFLKVKNFIEIIWKWKIFSLNKFLYSDRPLKSESENENFQNLKVIGKK